MPEVVNDALRSMRKLTGTLVEEGVQSLPTRAAGLAAEGLNAAGILGRHRAKADDVLDSVGH